MRRSLQFFATALFIFSASASSIALDEVSGTIKEILDHRTDNFSSIRKDPHTTGDETDYTSTLMVAGAKQCYIAPVVKSVYANSCDILETKDRAVLAAKYKKYVKALQEALPAAWQVWTEKSAKPASECTFAGPDHSHPAAAVRWDLEGMNMDWYNLSVTVYAVGYAGSKR